jgi:hypothetical protein
MSPAVRRPRMPVTVLVPTLLLFSMLGWMSVPGPARAESPAGRLIVRLEGQPPAGIVAPTVVLTGLEGYRSTLIGALALAAGEVRYESLNEGTYEVRLERAAPEPVRIEVGVFPGGTTVVTADLVRGELHADPLRPDPFGVDDGWDAAWIEALPGAGEEGALAASTLPGAPAPAVLDGVALTSGGFRQSVSVGGGAIARASSTPIGISPASTGKTSRRVLSLSDRSYGEFEGASGSLGRSSFEGNIAHAFRSTAWKPQFLASLRSVNELDATGSVFQTSRLPHNGLDAIELFARAEATPSAATRLNFTLYGEGSQRDYYFEAFRYDPTHSPRQDRAEIQGALRMDHDLNPTTRVLAELGMQRTLVATGDGRYFDDMVMYNRSFLGDPGPDDALDDLYWTGDNRSTLGDEGHVYNSFRKNVQLDVNLKTEIWRNAGTARSDGAGLSIRRGTYRSYEHLNPAGGSFTAVHAIGYNGTGDAHSDDADRKPGHPLEISAFGTARRPCLGGDLEAGIRLGLFRSGQEPLRDLSHPLKFDGEGNEIGLDLGSVETHFTVDPRLGYTHSLGSTYRLWLTGGIETQPLPSEAVYYGAAYLRQAAASQDPDNANFAFGNPSLRPERDWTGLAALGRRIWGDITIRGGATAVRTTDAITARTYIPQDGSTEAVDPLVYYVNGKARDRLGLFTRIEWEPSARVRTRLSYDLSRARTSTVEPSVLDAGWIEPDLPGRRADLREGLPLNFPASDDGIARDAYPSDYDRRHRVSAAITVRTPADLIGEAGRFLFSDFEITALAHGASGAPFTWTQIDQENLSDPGGSVRLPQPDPKEADGVDRNSGRAPWTGQLDIRLAKNLYILRSRTELWVEGTNLTNQDNVVRVYSATGKADDDAWLAHYGRLSDADATLLYRQRLKEARNYGEPRLFRAGVRLSFP